jgi:hypothetical protein
LPDRSNCFLQLGSATSIARRSEQISIARQCADAAVRIPMAVWQRAGADSANAVIVSSRCGSARVVRRKKSMIANHLTLALVRFLDAGLRSSERRIVPRQPTFSFTARGWWLIGDRWRHPHVARTPCVSCDLNRHAAECPACGSFTNEACRYRRGLAWFAVDGGCAIMSRRGETYPLVGQTLRRLHAGG